MKYFKILLFTFLLLTFFRVNGQDFPKKANGFCNDYTNTLNSSERNELEGFLRNFEKKTSNEVVVAIFPDLQGHSVEQFSHEVAETWGIGKKNKNNGVLLAIFMKEHKMRIEVGYGLEPTLTDSRCKRIIDDYIVPNFKVKKYYEGIKSGLDVITEIIKGEFDPEELDRENNLPPEAVFVIIIFIVVVFLIIKFGGGRGGGTGIYFGGGGFGGGGSFGGGGGFGGFGGGSFGGGGSSGSW